jgi:hypothetical protein
MPIIFTRGGLSARGAGTFSLVPAPPPPPPTPGPPPPPPPPGPPPPVVQTVTFTSSGSWTAPSGVSSISNLGVFGGQFQEVPGQFIYTTDVILPVYSAFTSSGSPSGTAVIASYTYDQAGSYAEGDLAYFNSGGTGERAIGYNRLLLFYNPNLSPPTRYWYDLSFSGEIIIRGVATRASGPWDNRSGQIANGINSGWYVGVEVYYPPSTTNGTPSSAFGFTAPGGTQGDPSPSVGASFVSVTPGQTYTITVGQAGGAVTFQFTQG